jgi:putative transposase
MIDTSSKLPLVRQCQLLNLNRSTLYYEPVAMNEGNLLLMRHIDELHLERPHLGSRQMTLRLEDKGHSVNRKRVQRLMRKNGIYSSVSPDFKPKLQEDMYPGLTMTNLLKQEPFEITTINQVCFVDFTLIKTLEGWRYLAGVIDGFSKRVVG